jgi:predicted small metal-binding protein
MKTLSCREAGFDCDYVVKGENEKEIMNSGKEHAMMHHGMKQEDFTPEFKEKLKPLIKDSSDSK